VAKSKIKTSRAVDSRVKVERSTSSSLGNFDFQNNRSVINLILGAAVLVVLGFVLFNFLSNQKQANQDNLGPSQQTENTQPSGDVTKNNLPGKYTVKDGDTLFSIAQNYYGDGYKYTQLVTTNKLADANNISAGQVLDIPKLDNQVAQASPEASSVAVTPANQAMSPDQTQANQSLGTGGDPNQTIWGPKISTDTYTVQEGDWLSKVAGRAYGDIMQFNKIAQANNISNPDLIEPGTVLKIPR